MDEIETGTRVGKRDMEQYVDISLQLTGFDPVSVEQRAGIKDYFNFAEAMMAPLLSFRIPGEAE